MAIVKSIKGTTSEVMAAQGAGDIGIETSVTITDNLYTATDLLGIIGDTRKTITLTYTAAAFPITESTENLLKILAQVNKYTGPLNVSDTPTLYQLNNIAKKTTGIVTATLADTPISKATVEALKDVSSFDDITFASSQLIVDGKSELEAFVALNKKFPDTVWTVTDLKGTASEVAAIKAALKVDDAANVTIEGPISAADANAIAKGTTGALKATIKDGSVAATLKEIKDVVDTVNDDLTFKTTDKTADAKALVELAALVDQDFTSVQTITSKAADIGTNGATVIAALGLVPAGAAVTITNGTISAADAGAISNNVNAGKVTATITADTAFNIANALGAADTNDKDDALNITVDGTDATVVNLKLIDTQTALKVKVNAATVTAANFDAFEDIYVTGKNNFSNLGDENITVIGGANSAQADIVAKATSKVVTATINGETAASVVTNLKNANAKDDFTINLTNAATSAKDLLTLDGKTSITVNANAIALAITGTVAEVNKLLVADVDLTNPNFTLTGAVKAADANYIALNSGLTGVVTATIAADTAAKLDAALTDVTVNKYTLTVNGATASVAELNALALKTALPTASIKVDAKEITGTGAELNTLYTPGGKFANLGNENVKITDAASIPHIDAVLLATTGVVTASKTDLASELVKLTNATSGKDALTLKVNNETGTDLTSAANLLKLDGFTSVKVNATGITNGITGTAAQLKQLVAAKGVEIAKGVNITVTGPISAADLNVILKSTLGAVTASVTDTAAKLNAALKDASSSDVLTLTLSAGTAAAKDLLALDGKTSVAVDASAVTAITGTFVDVQKVVDAGVASTITLNANVNYTISGTVTAAQAEIIADSTGGVVTAATVAADTASNLVLALTDTDVNAYKLTVSGNDANAADLVALDGKTSITVNAAAIKNISGDAADVKNAYLANTMKTISGLGNETVDLSSATDANASLVKAINDYTTGVITLETLNTAATGGNFSLSQLGDLKGITGLANIAADNGVVDTINIFLKDLLAANDSKVNFTFKVTGDNPIVAIDTVKITNDLSGWTQTKNIAAEHTYTNGKTGQVVTIELVDAVFAV